MFLVYYGFYSVWEMFFPTLCSFFFILYLIGTKIRLEVFQARQGCEDETGVGLEGLATVREESESGGSPSNQTTTPMMSSW